MSFFRTLASSVYDPAFYKEARQHSFSTAFKYLIQYIALLTIAVSAFTLFVFWRFFYWGGAGEELKDYAIFLFPSDLVVTVENGVISTNQQEPYGIPMPEAFLSEVPYEYLIVFDTQYSVTIESARDFDTLVLIGKSSIGTQGDDGRFQIYPIDKSVNMKIDRAFVEQGAESIIAFVSTFGFWFLVLIIPFLAFVGLTIGIMIYLVFIALLIWVISEIKGVRIGYPQAYILGMYMISLPQALSLVFGQYVPFFRTIFIGILAVANIQKDAISQEVNNNDPSPPSRVSES